MRRAEGEQRAESGEQRAEGSRQRNVKYYVLGGILVAAVFSAQVAYFFDPITIITRALTFAVFPIAQLSIRTMGEAAASRFFPVDVQYFYRLNFPLPTSKCLKIYRTFYPCFSLRPLRSLRLEVAFSPQL